jgi:hypothetical protein
VRWQHGADGQGSPAYCKSCKKIRREDWRCGGCNEPPIWDENVPIVELWLAMQTQWRTSFGGVIGLDYNVALQLMPAYDLDDARTALHGLQLMESETLAIFAERAKRAD